MDAIDQPRRAPPAVVSASGVSTKVASEQPSKWCGLARRRECLLPTWRGWLIFLLLAAFLVWLAFHRIHPFLAVTDPISGGCMVIEGWAPDYALSAAFAEFKAGHYDHIYTVGGPLEFGAPLSEYKSYAQRAAATLIKMGADTNRLEAVPAPGVRQDRTYAAAAALGKWFQEHKIPHRQVQLISEGPHARRSRLLFQAALGKQVKVGVIAIPGQEYDPRRWWRTSSGVRVVIDEAVAYLYARLIFRGPAETEH